ncbi:uncharacterized protein YkwD [Crossiella equi]|uniref:Uncharacterized protein YkwD n=1 Tax=Crossiella equi TaxID=130796 RepID=A0ABS5A9E2_9PSEU|nr:CAP domain-containing protein [Crossiella equi]MBP2473204.1 uncharacterized protein YkwD [Crossiella equi]
MRRTQLIALPLVAAALLVPGVASAAPQVHAAPSAQAVQGAAEDILALTNAERAKAGCPALTLNAALGKAAGGHSADMAQRNFFDHVNPDGAGPVQRATAAGYRYRMLGENIYAGRRDARSAMTAWMNSAGHRRNILNCGYRELGVGYADRAGSRYRYYWTQVFGTPAN